MNEHSIIIRLTTTTGRTFIITMDTDPMYSVTTWVVSSCVVFEPSRSLGTQCPTSHMPDDLRRQLREIVGNQLL